MRFRDLIVVLALVALFAFAGSASAACGGKGNNRVVANVNRGVIQRVVGNQLLTFDRLGNVVRRQFVNAGNNNALVNLNLGRQSLADRLLFGQ